MRMRLKRPIKIPPGPAIANEWQARVYQIQYRIYRSNKRHSLISFLIIMMSHKEIRSFDSIFLIFCRLRLRSERIEYVDFREI